MTSPIDRSEPLRASVAEIAAAIADVPELVFGPSGGAPGRFHAVVSIELGPGTPCQQVMAVELGAVERWGRAVRWHVSCTPVGQHRVLPRFDGVLEAVEGPAGTMLRMAGRCTALLSVMGSQTADSQALAECSIGELVGWLARRVDAAVRRSTRFALASSH